ncbi:MAG: hypothetical protein AAFS10_15480 [Myxococcota bacterium]
MTRTALLLSLALLLASSAVRADEVHYENFRYGQRAMGAGGAMVAFPGEPEASWYNPAALALIQGTRLSGSLQFFGSERHTLTDGLRSQTTGNTDLTSSDVLLLPSSSVLSYAFGADDQHVIALSSFLVSERDETFSDTIETRLIDGNQWLDQSLTFTRQDIDRIVYIGPSWAWRSTPTFTLGLSVFYARREQNAQALTSFTEQRRQQDSGALLSTTFDDTLASTTIDDGALLARLGVLVVQGRLSFGATATTQSIALHGSGRLAYTFTDSGDPADTSGLNPNNPDPFRELVNVSDVDAQTIYPWNFAAGLAYRVPSRWAVASQVSVYLPSQYDRLELNASQQELIANSLVNRVERQWVVNGALGAEWYATARVPLRFGAFTNRSAAPDIPSNPTMLMLPKVDLYGVTTSVGFIGDKRAINIGAEVQWGRGHDVVLNDVRQIWRPAFVRVDREQFRAVLFLSGAIDFAAKTAQDLVEERPSPQPSPNP